MKESIRLLLLFDLIIMVDDDDDCESILFKREFGTVCVLWCGHNNWCGIPRKICRNVIDYVFFCAYCDETRNGTNRRL